MFITIVLMTPISKFFFALCVVTRRKIRWRWETILKWIKFNCVRSRKSFQYKVTQNVKQYEKRFKLFFYFSLPNFTWEMLVPNNEYHNVRDVSLRQPPKAIKLNSKAESLRHSPFPHHHTSTLIYLFRNIFGWWKTRIKMCDKLNFSFFVTQKPENAILMKRRKLNKLLETWKTLFAIILRFYVKAEMMMKRCKLIAKCWNWANWHV